MIMNFDWNRLLKLALLSGATSPYQPLCLIFFFTVYTDLYTVMNLELPRQR